MNFKQFYKEQEVLNEFGDSGVDYIAKQAGKITGAVSKITGKIITKILKTINPFKFLANHAKKIYDELKNKVNNLIELAEKIYPYDKTLYNQMRKDNKVFSDYIVQYFNTQAINKKVSIGKMYSPGFDIIFRVYAAAKEGLIEYADSYEIKTEPVLSIKTLDDAFEYSKLRIPKLQDDAAVVDYFKKNWNVETNQLGKWISTATLFSLWKNKVEGTDKEGVESLFIDYIVRETNHVSLDEINKRILGLIEEGKEVNVDNLKESLGVTNNGFVATVKNMMETGSSVIGKTEDTFDEADVVAFITQCKKLGKNNVVLDVERLANEYIVIKYLMKKNRITENISKVLLPADFVNVFSNVRDKNLFSKLQKSNNSVKNVFQSNFLKLFDPHGLNGKKMDKNLVDNIDELFRFLCSSSGITNG